jgi:hypothetical protein
MKRPTVGNPSKKQQFVNPRRRKLLSQHLKDTSRSIRLRHKRDNLSLSLLLVFSHKWCQQVIVQQTLRANLSQVGEADPGSCSLLLTLVS